LGGTFLGNRNWKKVQGADREARRAGITGRGQTESTLGGKEGGTEKSRVVVVKKVKGNASLTGKGGQSGVGR